MRVRVVDVLVALVWPVTVPEARNRLVQNQPERGGRERGSRGELPARRATRASKEPESEGRSRDQDDGNGLDLVRDALQLVVVPHEGVDGVKKPVVHGLG